MARSDGTSTVYHIAHAADACSNVNGLCQTLSQFASGSNLPATSNINLILLEGHHCLNTSMRISNLGNFTMYSNNSMPVVNCTCRSSSPIILLSTQNIYISRLSFVGCRISVINTIGSLLLSNSRLEGQGITGTALILDNVAHAVIDRTLFAFNNVGTTIGRRLPPDNVQSSVGGAVFASWSTINISHSRFENNSAGFGGAIFTEQQCSTTIVNSTFINNIAQGYYGSGGAFYDHQSTVNIYTSIFNLNTAGSGGALYFYSSTARVKNCSLRNNSAINSGGAQRGLQSTIDFDTCVFRFNSAMRWGGVMDNKAGSNITIRHSSFEENTAFLHQGGVVRTSLDTVTITNSTFLFNTAVDSSGGALSGLDSNFSISYCQFIGNSASYRGGALYTIGSMTMLEIIDYSNLFSEVKKDGTVFMNNTAQYGGALYSTARNMVINGSVLASHNWASDSNVMYFALTNGKILGNLTFSYNHGSLVLLSSTIIVEASCEFINNSNSGAITILQSILNLKGSYNLEHNHGQNGGAVYAVESQLYINAPVHISNNKAVENGGGMYLYQSEIVCGQICHLIFQKNQANKRGGGIHAISSLIVLNAPHLSYQPKWIEFNENSASEGGGLLLESNAKLYVVQYNSRFKRDRLSDYTIAFRSNNASYGGAVFVDDDTYSIGVCSNTSNSPTAECFFQVLARHLTYYSDLYTTHLQFLNNHAMKSGSILFGGLLDRCTRSPFAEITQKLGSDTTVNGIEYLEDASSLTSYDIVSISSAPVRVCPCINGKKNCSHIPYVRVKKGQAFSISITVSDQVGHPVNATVNSYLSSTESDLIEGQINFVTKTCEEVTMKILSLHDSEQLTVYASEGPCKDASLSVTTVHVHFIPCNLCPIGFQPADTSCDCFCHDKIKDYVDCNSTSEILVRQFDVWIAYTNDTGVAGYLIYVHCPFGYCFEAGVPVNLNQLHGEDAQCRFNRTGLLCGACQHGLSLSLGSSQCLLCPHYWPASFFFITSATIIAGIVLVVIILLLNLTVAVGTLNGLIFYANIIAVNKSIFFPFAETNFFTVFISWLNLELGIETCYFPGMDSYIKAWLQLVFPTYVIVLVILVIVISNYSVRFSHIIGKRNPVATLATLILLSYAKFLQTVITALSYGTLEYPDGVKYTVWLPDANVTYVQGKHIALFCAAILILLFGLVYTVLLFSWHWLPSCTNWRLLKVIRNPKFHNFVEVYTVPYESKHQYWTGLLLFVRIALYLVAAVNVAGGPKVTLASVSIVIICIVIIKNFIGSVYTKRGIDLLDTIFHCNLLFLSIFTWLALDTGLDRRAISYVSVIVSFILLLAIVTYHVYTHTKMFSKLQTYKCCNNAKFSKLQKYKNCKVFNNIFLRKNKNSKHMQTPDLEHDDIDGLYSLFESENDSTNVTHDKTGINSELQKITYSVVDIPKPSSVDLEGSAERNEPGKALVHVIIIILLLDCFNLQRSPYCRLFQRRGRDIRSGNKSQTRIPTCTRE